MKLVDTHCHIQEIGMNHDDKSITDKWSEAVITDLDLVISDAVASGVSDMICVGCDLSSSKRAVEVAVIHDELWASPGIHPHEASAFLGLGQHDDFRDIFSLQRSSGGSKIVAVGECGLDFFYNHSPRDHQFEVLEFQLQLALDYKLPVIFHVRQAFSEFWPVVDNFTGIRGVLHSFTDSVVNMERAVSQGLYIGVNGIATFTKESEQINMFSRVPLSKLLLETDAPFLTPSPIRGTINTPVNVTYITKHMAELHNLTLQEIALATTTNAKSLFGI